MKAQVVRKERRKRKLVTNVAFAWWTAVFALVLGFSAVKNFKQGVEQQEAMEQSRVGRSLLASKNGGAEDWNPVHTATEYAGPLGWAGIFLWVPMVIWIFGGVAIAADEYFQPALESISDALDLTADVRGATFLAAASSAPEFFTSFADTFLVSDEGGEGFGVGTIVGSAIFNVLIIVALSTIPTMSAASELENNKPVLEVLEGQDAELVEKKYKSRLRAWENKMKKLEEEGSYLPIDWYPLLRDTVFYSISIILLVTSFATDEPDKEDKKPHITEGCIKWYESLVYILIYCLYIAYMMKSAELRPYAETLKEKLLCECCKDHDDSNRKPKHQDINDKPQGPLDVSNAAQELKEKEKLEQSAAKSVSSMQTSSDDDSDDDEEQGLFDGIIGFEDEWNTPLGVCCNVAGIFTIPFKFLFKLTIPDVSRPAMEQHYVISFFMNILWIGFLSAMMVKIVSWIGVIIQFDPVAMGLIVLAAGTSVPDALGSYNEAKHGNADAAVSNALGSNVFDICIGLGVPWFIFSLSKVCFIMEVTFIITPVQCRN